jgi:hypothetical protein
MGTNSINNMVMATKKIILRGRRGYLVEKEPKSVEIVSIEPQKEPEIEKKGEEEGKIEIPAKKLSWWQKVDKFLQKKVILKLE